MVIQIFTSMHLRNRSFERSEAGGLGACPHEISEETMCVRRFFKFLNRERGCRMEGVLG